MSACGDCANVREACPRLALPRRTEENWRITRSTEVLRTTIPGWGAYRTSFGQHRAHLKHLPPEAVLWAAPYAAIECGLYLATKQLSRRSYRVRREPPIAAAARAGFRRTRLALRANWFLGPDDAADEAIGQSSNSGFEAPKRLAQCLKAAPALPGLRRQSWLVCDEASGESSDVQSRAKRLCRTAGLSRFSTDLVGQTSGLAIEHVESVHLLPLLEPC